MYRCQCRFRRSDGLNSESGGEIDGDGQPQIFLSSSVRSSKKNSMRTFQIWSEGDCFCCSVYGSNEICSLSPHNGRPQIFLRFKAMGQTNQSLDSSIPISSAPSTATLLTTISNEINRNICSLEDSMDFLYSEEAIELGTHYSVINMCRTPAVCLTLDTWLKVTSQAI